MIVSRNPPRCAGPWKHVVWDGRTIGPWIYELDGAQGVVNLTGRSVDCIKPPDHCDEILRSRVDATHVLGLAMRQVTNPPPVWVQMSTAHIYGAPPSAACTEDSALGYGLAPDVGRAWEEAYRDAVLTSQRQVILRTSFVIGRDRGAGCGAMAKLLPLARWGLGGRVGSGRQGMSWIHEVDMNRLFLRSLTDAAMTGVYIASAPTPSPRSSSCMSCVVRWVCRSDFPPPNGWSGWEPAGCCALIPNWPFTVDLSSHAVWRTSDSSSPIPSSPKHWPRYWGSHPDASSRILRRQRCSSLSLIRWTCGHG